MTSDRVFLRGRSVLPWFSARTPQTSPGGVWFGSDNNNNNMTSNSYRQENWEQWARRTGRPLLPVHDGLDEVDEAVMEVFMQCLGNLHYDGPLVKSVQDDVFRFLTWLSHAVCRGPQPTWTPPSLAAGCGTVMNHMSDFVTQRQLGALRKCWHWFIECDTVQAREEASLRRSTPAESGADSGSDDDVSENVSDADVEVSNDRDTDVDVDSDGGDTETARTSAYYWVAPDPRLRCLMGPDNEARFRPPWWHQVPDERTCHAPQTAAARRDSFARMQEAPYLFDERAGRLANGVRVGSLMRPPLFCPNEEGHFLGYSGSGVLGYFPLYNPARPDAVYSEGALARLRETEAPTMATIVSRSVLRPDQVAGQLHHPDQQARVVESALQTETPTQNRRRRREESKAREERNWTEREKWQGGKRGSLLGGGSRSSPRPVPEGQEDSEDDERDEVVNLEDSDPEDGEAGPSTLAHFAELDGPHARHVTELAVPCSPGDDISVTASDVERNSEFGWDLAREAAAEVVASLVNADQQPAPSSPPATPEPHATSMDWAGPETAVARTPTEALLLLARQEARVQIARQQALEAAMEREAVAASRAQRAAAANLSQREALAEAVSRRATQAARQATPQSAPPDPAAARAAQAARQATPQSAPPARAALVNGWHAAERRLPTVRTGHVRHIRRVPSSEFHRDPRTRGTPAVHLRRGQERPGHLPHGLGARCVRSSLVQRRPHARPPAPLPRRL